MPSRKTIFAHLPSDGHEHSFSQEEERGTGVDWGGLGTVVGKSLVAKRLLYFEIAVNTLVDRLLPPSYPLF
jgi:hypothetical protein